jgi:chromosomal replication initiator protein
MWFDRAARLSYEDDSNTLVVAVPNRFVADWIDRNFQDQLRVAARHELGPDVDLDVRVDAIPFAAAPTAAAFDPAAPAHPAKAAHHHPRTPRAGDNSCSGAPLYARYKLDDFVVGPSNELAYAAALRLSADDEPAPGAGAPASAGGASGGPLFIHGGVGLGKTHLLQGICRRVLDRHPDARVYYSTGEQFTNDFLSAIRTNRLEQFRKRIRRLDLLAVDDVHFLANKEKTQQEFLHSFDAIELGGARVVLASDNHPKLIRQFSEALVSRCIRGMVVEIRQPDTATRMKILHVLAQRRGISLRETTIASLAAHCQGSVREIEGTLTLLQALAELATDVPSSDLTAAVPLAALPGAPVHEPATNNAPASAPAVARPALADAPRALKVIGHVLVNRLFSAELENRPQRVVRFETILDVICAKFAVTRPQLMNGDRHRQLVVARSLAVYLARELTTLSYPEISAALGKASHSAALTADKRLRGQLALNPAPKVILPATATAVAEELALPDLAERLKYAIQHG